MKLLPNRTCHRFSREQAVTVAVINKVFSLLVVGSSLKFVMGPKSFGLLMIHKVLSEIFMPVVVCEQ